MGQRRLSIHVHGTTAKLVTGAPSEAIREVSDVCSYEVAGAEHMVRQGKYPGWDGRKRLFHTGTKRFMTGLVPRVHKLLTDLGYVVEIMVYTRGALGINFGDTNFEAFDEREYQERAVQAWTSNYRRGVLRVATGGGKTYMAARCIKDSGLATVFLVHTKDLLYQAKDVFTKIFGESYVGQIGDGVVEMAPITVATIQTLSRSLDIEYEEGDEDNRWKDDETRFDNPTEFIQSRGLVIMDECHRVAAPTALELISRFKNAENLLGLSASPWRDDGADLALEAAFGPVFYSVSASDLTRQGYLVPAVIRMLEVPPRPGLSVQKYPQIYAKYVVENDTRNAMGVEAGLQSFRSGGTVLFLVRQVRHGKEIQRMLSEEVGTWVPFIYGQSSSNERRDVVEKMRTGKLKIAVASTIADEGLDIPSLDTIVLMGSGKSSVKALQRVGRALRPYGGKEHATIVDFRDNIKYLIEHSERREALYRTEDEWGIIDV